MSKVIRDLVSHVRDIYQTRDFIPLHAPLFEGNEKEYVADTIDSTFVSSVGAYVDRFEELVEKYTGIDKAVATVNGTAALHAALYASEVQPGDIVITQALTFVATGNVIFHLGATPVFVDISRNTLGLCPAALEEYLLRHAELDDNRHCIHMASGKRIRAVVPMHTFGHPVELDELIAVSRKWNIALVEDAAESLGSLYKGKHTGTFGQYSALSFNGNKIITTGGGGIVLCSDKGKGQKIKHLTTTAKVPHAYEFFHDEPGFNYRMPNLNAALGCGQIEVLDDLLLKKRAVAHSYESFFAESEYQFVKEPEHARSNYWLNAVICRDLSARNLLLERTNESGVMTRPVWTLLTRLPMFKNALRGNLQVSEYIEARLVNLPSSATKDILCEK